MARSSLFTGAVKLHYLFAPIGTNRENSAEEAIGALFIQGDKNDPTYRAGGVQCYGSKDELSFIIHGALGKPSSS